MNKIENKNCFTMLPHTHTHQPGLNQNNFLPLIGGEGPFLMVGGCFPK